MAVLSEKKFGSSAKSVNILAEKLTSIDWYKKVGQEDEETKDLASELLNTLNVSHFHIEWIEKDKIVETLNKVSLSGSSLWDKLKDVPDQLKEKIDELNQGELLKLVVDRVPEAVFHPAFEAAFEKFGGEEKVVQFFVGQAMYFATLICAAELANESTLSTQFIALLESGHVPIGPQGDIIYII